MPRTNNLTRKKPTKPAPVWTDALSVEQLRTAHDDLCTAYHRRAAGIRLAVDRLVGIDANLLVVVESGALSLESSRGSTVLQAGDSALLIPGEVYLSEVPESGCEVSYWLVSFEARLLVEVVGNDPTARHFAASVAPVYHGVYPHRNTLPSLRACCLPTPITNVKKTIVLMLKSASAAVFSFLRDGYFQHRTLLQELARQGFPVTTRLPGGHPFGQAFKVYHGVTPKTWLKRSKQPSSAACR